MFDVWGSGGVNDGLVGGVVSRRGDLWGELSCCDDVFRLFFIAEVRLAGKRAQLRARVSKLEGSPGLRQHDERRVMTNSAS